MNIMLLTLLGCSEPSIAPGASHPSEARSRVEQRADALLCKRAYEGARRKGWVSGPDTDLEERFVTKCVALEFGDDGLRCLDPFLFEQDTSCLDTLGAVREKVNELNAVLGLDPWEDEPLIQATPEQLAQYPDVKPASGPTGKWVVTDPKPYACTITVTRNGENYLVRSKFPDGSILDEALELRGQKLVPVQGSVTGDHWRFTGSELQAWDATGRIYSAKRTGG